MRKRILFLLLILTLGFIWGHSCMPQTVSAAESASITELVEPVLELVVGAGNVTDHLVRKLAHFSEFAVLGAELALLLAAKKTGVIHACAFGLLAGFVDETIQIFAFRGDMISDVWLDFGGAVFGVILASLLCLLIRRTRKNAADGKEKD